MTKEELQKLKEDLQAEEAKLVRELSAVAVENPAVKGDFEPAMPNYGDTLDDSINESTDLVTNVAMEQELESHLEKIRDAISKIENGSYGVCSNCKQDINPERLKAMTAASLCVSCAQGQK